MYEIVIIEDEFNAQQVLQKLLKLLFPNFKVIAIFSTIKEAKEFLERNSVDLIFLDIELEDGISLDLLRELQEIKFQVIFTTGNSQYAIDAIKFSAVDYILKPIDPIELEIAIKHAIQKIDKNKTNSSLLLLVDKYKKNEEKTIIVKTHNNIYYLNVNNIILLESNGAYTKIFSTDKTILASKHLKYYEKILLTFGFIRTHQSYLINNTHIQSINKATIILTNNIEAIIATRKYKKVIEQINKIKNISTS